MLKRLDKYVKTVAKSTDLNIALMYNTDNLIVSFFVSFVILDWMYTNNMDLVIVWRYMHVY